MTVEVVEGENNRNVMAVEGGGGGGGGGEGYREGRKKGVMAVGVVVVMYPARIMQ